ncbi:MAG: DUF5060 domain-containing protein, partial [Anaerolineaceae bacterium]|nr:DUF5060 domain-containing protein [Anaerolineaceae bacterium]
MIRSDLFKRFCLAGLMLIISLLVLNIYSIKAKIQDQFPLAASALLFSDTFDRPDNNLIGNGWIEVEASGAQLGILDNRLCFLDTSDVPNRPIAQIDFQQVSSGELLWNFNFDWIRITQEGTYRVFMQMGDQVLLSSDNQNYGVGVNLVWTRINDIHQTLGYRQAGVDTAISAVSGPTDFSVLVNLDKHTFQVSLDGEVIQPDIPFDNHVNINSVRFFSDVLNDEYFSGRCFDNLSLETLSTIPPTQTPTPTSTNTLVPTSTIFSTNTPLPSVTPTETLIPTAIPTATEIATSTLAPTLTPTVLPTATDIATSTTVPTHTPTVPATPTPIPSTLIIFSDAFDRPDSSSIGNEWVEVEATGAEVGILDDRLCFLDTSDVPTRPLAQVDFQQVSDGELEWNFDFDWTRIAQEGTYRVFMQLGENALMNNYDQNNGVGVNLVWTRINDIHQTLGYRQADVDTALRVVSGPTSFSVLVNLDTHTYQISLDGEVIQTDIPFDNQVNIDTLRFFSDVLNDEFFSGRCFDNLSLETLSTIPPTQTPLPTNTLTPTPLPTNTPTPTPLPTNTPTPTDPATPTPIPSFSLYQSVEFVLTGPNSIGMGTPNPFQIEVEITLSGPGGQTYTVPGFFDGDGNGGMDGSTWKVRFNPDVPGSWTFISSSVEPLLDGHIGTFNVIDDRVCQTYQPGGLPEFDCVGRLEHTGDHYLRFSNGTYWLKGGEDDPEDFLAPGINAGFSNKYQAIDYLASQGANSLYMMLNNVGGDGNNVWPWVGATSSEAQNNHERFDLVKLTEWEDLFAYLQSRGMVLHLVFEDDSGWTGFNHALFYRQMIARFGHHKGLIWNISEEYNENYTADQVKAFAQLVRDLDPYEHPITVHLFGSLDNWLPFVGDDRFDMTSFQTEKTPVNSEAAAWFDQVENSGRIIPISFDETGQIGTLD